MTQQIICENHYHERPPSVPKQYPNTTNDIAYIEGWRRLNKKWICPYCISKLRELYNQMYDQKMNAAEERQARDKTARKMIEEAEQEFLEEIDSIERRYESLVHLIMD